MRLERGDTIGVVAPGFAVRRGDLEAGVAVLERMGYRVRLGDHVLDRAGYLAGDDAGRGSDLEAMLTDRDVRAVWFARGGYGTARLLDGLRATLARRRPKLLVGYSDATALFAAVTRRAAGRCLYGPVVTELGDRGLYDRASLRALLAGRPVELRFRGRQVLAAGRARGRLIGGNLSVWTHLCGTGYLPDPRGCVLFVEDVGEQVYRIDRMLTQLDQARAFDGLSAVLLGCFTTEPRKRFPPDRALADLFREFFAGRGIPVVTALPVGHRRAKRTLPLGGTATVDTRSGRIELTP